MKRETLTLPLSSSKVERNSVKALMKEIDEYEATPEDQYRPEVANKALKERKDER